MLLHSRIVTFRTSPRKLMPWALGITEYVNTRSSVPVSLWMADYGYPIGTLSWSALLESQAQLAQALEPLAGDDGYHDLLDAAAAMVDLVFFHSSDSSRSRMMTLVLIRFGTSMPTEDLPGTGARMWMRSALSAAAMLFESAEIFSNFTPGAGCNS